MQDTDLIEALRGVQDPELGISIVDFGLVRLAEWTASGIEVSLGLPSLCPATELLIEQTRSALQRRFPEVRSIRVHIDTSRPCSPDRLNDAGRRALGWEPAKAGPARTPVSTPRDGAKRWIQ